MRPSASWSRWDFVKYQCIVVLNFLVIVNILYYNFLMSPILSSQIIAKINSRQYQKGFWSGPREKGGDWKTALLKYNHCLDILFTSDTALDSSWEEICCCGKPLEIIWDCLLPLIYLASTSTEAGSVLPTALVVVCRARATRTQYFFVNKKACCICSDISVSCMSIAESTSAVFSDLIAPWSWTSNVSVSFLFSAASKINPTCTQRSD